MGKQFTDSQVELAAECIGDRLCRKVAPFTNWATIAESSDWKTVIRGLARHALEHGYVPPPRPKAARERLMERLRHSARCEEWDSCNWPDTYWFSYSDALLARWPGIARVIEEES